MPCILLSWYEPINVIYVAVQSHLFPKDHDPYVLHYGY